MLTATSTHYSASQQIADQIKTVSIANQKNAIAALVLAFSNDPALRWMYPDSHQFLTYFPRFAKAFGGKAFEQGTAYAIDDYSGAALWFPPNVEIDEEALVELLQESVSETIQDDLFAVFEQMGSFHPNEPHWYLPLIGVEPIQQGKGYGSALMQAALMQCDRDQTPAYLESSNPANIPFYERHGFELLEMIQVRTSPPISLMVRLPRHHR